MKLAPSAQRDLEEIEDYFIAQIGHTRARRIMDAIVEKLETLDGIAVRAGALRVEAGPGIRSWPIGRYMAYYREIGNEVEIARIRHGSRDPRTLPEISFMRRYVQAGFAA